VRRVLVLIAAVLVQSCMGGIYAWSAFVPHLREAHGFSAASMQLVFGTCFLVFTVSLLVTGRLLDRSGPRPLMVASAVLLAGGYLIAAAAGGSWFLLWLGIGVVGGLGIGCGYLCPIATAIRWFPAHKGLVAGLAVAGYGGGAILLANLAEHLLARDWSVSRIFVLVGATYGPVLLLAGMLLFTPPDAGEEQTVTFRRRDLLHDARFWKLFAAMFCGTLPGLMISGSLKPLGLWFGLGAGAAAAISTFAVGSALGRVAWGWVHDRLGGRRATLCALGAIAGSVAVLAGAGATVPTFVTAALLAGFCYGSSFALYPAQVAEVYGARVVGTVYAVVMLAHGLAAEVGPGTAGWLFDVTGSWFPGLALSFVVALAGLVFFARRSAGDEVA